MDREDEKFWCSYIPENETKQKNLETFFIALIMVEMLQWSLIGVFFYNLSTMQLKFILKNLKLRFIRNMELHSPFQTIDVLHKYLFFASFIKYLPSGNVPCCRQ